MAAIFVDSLATLQISWSLILLLVAYFVPLFTLASTLMIMLGVAVSDTRQGQQIAGAFSFLFLLPLFFSPLLGSNPDGPLMVVLTLFPTTSLLTVAMRWAATLVPVWQVVASWLILAGCAGAGLWAHAQGLPPRHAALRPAPDAARRCSRPCGRGGDRHAAGVAHRQDTRPAPTWAASRSGSPPSCCPRRW